MKFQYLREFTVVARNREMQAAADELGISLSALSKHLKSIEMELGAPLFIRSRHTILSQYGRIMLPYAQELVALQNDYVNDFAKNKKRPEEILTIGMSAIQFKEQATRLVESFMLANPSYPVEIIEAGSSELPEYVLSGQCDMAFYRSLPTLKRDPDLVYHPFTTSNVVAFLPKKHFLANRESLTFEDIRNEKIYLRYENSSIHRACVERFNALGIKPDISFVSSFSVYDEVKKGTGISLYLSPPLYNEYDDFITIIPIKPDIPSFVDIIYKQGPISEAESKFLHFVISSRQLFSKTV